MSDNQVAIAGVTQNESTLVIEWANGETSGFHHAWLRDCCYCEICGDCYSSLRNYVPDLDNLNAFPRHFSFEPDELRVEWAADGHRSTYAADWLHANRYDDAARRARHIDYVHWDGSTGISALEFDFDQATREESTRLSLQRQLITHGLVILRGGPAESGGVLRFAELFGEVAESAYGAVFDLAPSNKVGTAGTTLKAVPPHSDEAFVYAPPGIEALACIRPADDGGDSIMVDGIGIAEKLRLEDPVAFNLLARWNHHYVRVHPGQLDQRARVPVISLDDDGEVSGIRLHTRASAPLDLPESVMPGYLAAYHRLCAMMMAPENQLRLRLAAGDAVVFDNHRALHARTAFSDRQRFMQICGVTREKFHESFRLLAARLGDIESSNLVLRAGACR